LGDLLIVTRSEPAIFAIISPALHMHAWLNRFSPFAAVGVFGDGACSCSRMTAPGSADAALGDAGHSDDATAIDAAIGSWEMSLQADSAADLAPIPSVCNPQLGIWRAISTDLTHWTMRGATRELEWDGSLATETYGWIAAGDVAVVGGEYRYYYPAFSTLAPRSSDWGVPIQGWTLATSLIVMDMARR